MTISKNIRTPGVYTEYNLNAQRSGLPVANQKILFLTTDQFVTSSSTPKDLYDGSTAKTLFGADSNAEAMITAALKVSSYLDVQVLGKSVAE